MKVKYVALFTVLFLFGFLQAQPAPKYSKARYNQAKKASSTKKKISADDVIGTWQLVKFKHGPQSKKRKPLTSCDTSMPWVFYKDSLSNKLLLKCEKIENCDDYGFESEWLFNGSSLIIKKSKIMGLGGISSSGKFNLKELTEEHMVLEFMKHLYVFRRINTDK